MNNLVSKAPPLHLISHGLKRYELKGSPQFNVVPKADLYVDCRGIKEHGLDRNNFTKFKEQIQLHSPITVQAIREQIVDSLRHVPDRRMRDNPKVQNRPYVVCFMCAFGMNRSFTTKYIVGEQLTKLGYEVHIPTEAPPSKL